MGIRIQLSKRYSIAGGLASLAMLWGQCAIAASVISLVSPAPVLAPVSEILQAEVESIRNQVDLLPYQKLPRQAQIEDILRPLDAIRTGELSMTELRFNEGTLIRIGSSSLFKFSSEADPVKRMDASGIRAQIHLEMQDGIALVSVSPTDADEEAIAVQLNLPQSQVNIAAAPSPGPDGTPSSEQEEKASKVLTMHDAALNTDYVIALSDGTVTVSDTSGKTMTPVPAGHLVTVSNGRIEPPQPVDPAKFIQESQWADFPVAEATSSSPEPLKSAAPLSSPPAPGTVSSGGSGPALLPSSGISELPIQIPSPLANPGASGPDLQTSLPQPADSPQFSPDDFGPIESPILSPVEVPSDLGEPNEFWPVAEPSVVLPQKNALSPKPPLLPSRLFSKPSVPQASPTTPNDMVSDRPEASPSSDEDVFNPVMPEREFYVPLLPSLDQPSSVKTDFLPLPGFEEEAAKPIPEPSGGRALLVGLLGWMGYRGWRFVRRRQSS